MDEDALPIPLQIAHQHMVDHPVAEVRRKDLTQPAAGWRNSVKNPDSDGSPLSRHNSVARR
jgi:hypothetical protein